MDNVWGFPHKDVGASLSENAAMHAASLINSEELCLFFLKIEGDLVLLFRMTLHASQPD